VLTSAPRGAAVGTRVTVEGGRVMAVEDAPARGGTEVTVCDLFYNTPARLKHLKTVHTELGHITDYVTRFALARPDVAFAYTHNGLQPRLRLLHRSQQAQFAPRAAGPL